ncbi:MAG: HAD-IA family hydrolase [Draconibacterium sp.]
MGHKCIIFDCDGVLVDSERISANVFQTMMRELDVVLDFDVVLEQITGTSMKENLKFFSKHLGKNLPENFEQEFRKRSYQAFKNDLKPIKGVREILDKIKIPIGVASSGPVEKIKQNLQTTSLNHYFGENIFSSYQIGSWKPEPEIYLHAAKSMQFKPEECAVIEDSLVGVQAAKAGGFQVFALSNKKHDEAFKAFGASVFSEMRELGNLLNLD